MLSRIDAGPDHLLLRSAPVWVNRRKVAATWTLARLRPEKPGEAVGRYQVAVGLAFGSLALAILLCLSLGWTVARQARERGRMQVELRRNERLAALGKLLAGVAHEVRNPLAGLRSTAQLWQRGAGPPAEEGIADLLAEVDRLEAIVSRLLQFTRVENLKIEPGDLNEVVSSAAHLARSIAEGQGVSVEFEPGEGLPDVPIEPASVLQVLRSLTTNALQAMPRGGRLKLSTAVGPGRRTVEVRVSDTGPGLSTDERAHLFEPFFTTEGAGDRARPGDRPGDRPRPSRPVASPVARRPRRGHVRPDPAGRRRPDFAPGPRVE